MRGICRLLFVALPALLSGQIALSDPQALIISGGLDKLNDHERFYNVSKLVWEVEKARGLSPELVASDGAWDFARSGQSFSARNKENVEKAIKLAAARLRPGEPLTIFVNDHGDPPDSIRDPLSSKIILYGGALSLLYPKLADWDLMRLIQKYVPKTNRVKLVGIQCFAGGLHSISFNLPNVCSAASVDFRTASRSAPEMDLYGRGFWSEVRDRKLDIDGDGKTSLYEAHLAGSALDVLNENKGELSSMAYVDSVLGVDAYSGKDHWGLERLILGVSSGPAGPAIPKLCEIDAPDFDEAKIRKLASDIDRMVEQSGAGVSEAKAPPVPSLEKVYRQAMSEWSKNKDRDLKRLRELQAEAAKDKEEWGKLSQAEKLWRRAEYTKKFDELELRARTELRTYMAVVQLIQRLDRVEQFSRKATAAQKEKFASLLRCEWSPL